MLIRPESLEEKFQAMRKIEPTKKGLSTGFDDIDPLIKLAKGYMMIVSGYPSSGKSEFIDAVLVNMSLMYKWRVLYFSPENHPIEEHMCKLAEKFIGKKMRQFTAGEFKACMDYLQQYYTWIDLEEPDLDSLVKLAKEENKTRGIDCFVIDPWNAVTHSRGTAMIHEYLSNALSKIIRLARTEKILVIIIAHPKAPVMDKTGKIEMPNLYSISDGAMWRNKADYGIICHRPNMMKDEMIVAAQKVKQKWMGHVGEVVLDYDYLSGRYKGKKEQKFILPNEIQSPF